MNRLFTTCFLLASLAVGAEAGELGPNDFQISHLAKDGRFDATTAAITYSPDDNEFLLVWRGDDDLVVGMVDNHFEVWGQRLSPALSPIGARFRISTTGADDTIEQAVNDPAVVYNATAGEYFVVWAGALASGELEIFGQRIESVSGMLVGGNLRISNQGAAGSLKYEAIQPGLAYSATQDQYMVVWRGDATTIPLFDDDFEIFGQRLTSAGVPVGMTLQLSKTGPDNDPDYPTARPAVTWDRTRDDYMVVWQADVIDTGVQWEIHGQRINAPDGADVGAELWFSDAATSGNDQSPDVAYSHATQQYLVVWESDADPMAGKEIYGQLFDVPTGLQTGVEDFRISVTGPENTGGFPATSPVVAWCPDQARYLVSWSGQDDAASGFEIYAQLLDGNAAPVGPGKVRLSDMGADLGPYEARAPSLAHGTGIAAVVWHGDDDTGELIDDEFEIHGQIFDPATASEIFEDVLLTRVGLHHEQQLFSGDIAYNPSANEYLVVWLGQTAFQYGQFGVFARRVSADTGVVVDGVDIRVDDSSVTNPWSPSAVYNPATNEYLVSWGDHTSRVWGQRLDAVTLAEVGTNDILISSPLPLANTDVAEPALVYCSGTNRYVLVWAEDRLGSHEVELYMQQLDPWGVPQFANPMRITEFGLPGSTSYEPAEAAMAYSPSANTLLITWSGFGPASESRIYLQRFDLDTNVNIGSEVQISERMLQPGSFDREPSIAANSATGEFLVTWWGDLSQGGTGVFLQRLDGTGAEVGVDDMMLSDSLAFAVEPDVAYSSSKNEYLVCWEESPTGPSNTALRMVSSAGSPLGSSAITLNDSGPVSADVSGLRVAFGAAANDYLVVWSGVAEAQPFQMQGRDVRGQLYRSDTVTAAPGPVGPTAGPRIAAAFPNPFSTRMQFEIELDRTRNLQVDVYDVRGRRVLKVFEGRLVGPQVYSFGLTDRELASGVYWIRLAGTDFERTQRVTLLR